MARAVQLPRPLPTRQGEEGPRRVPELVPDRILKALVKELEQTVIERERKPTRSTDADPIPFPQPERVRYRYD